MYYDRHISFPRRKTFDYIIRVRRRVEKSEISHTKRLSRFMSMGRLRLVPSNSGKLGRYSVPLKDISIDLRKRKGE